MNEKHTGTDTMAEVATARHESGKDTTTSDELLKRRIYMEFQGFVLPMIGELINRLVLEGKSEDEVVAAVKTAAKGYSTFRLAFVRN
ncbi:TPA_asm: hypothetical protein G0G79_12970 [Salmonella enterica]|nr:hypothetical protein [Salmonella enterica]EEG5587141.1 hypothetical protein [Salmonella enterica]HAC8265602.1 hypothetical protein [Salmonella enterica]